MYKNHIAKPAIGFGYVIFLTANYQSYDNQRTIL